MRVGGGADRGMSFASVSTFDAPTLGVECDILTKGVLVAVGAVVESGVRVGIEVLSCIAVSAPGKTVGVQVAGRGALG